MYKIKITKETRFIFLFGAIFSLCISSVFFLSNVSLSTVNSEVNQFEPRPKSAGYWNLTGSKILVDDSDPNYDWSYTNSTYDWCSGSGTWADPYVIENVYIDGELDVAETPGKIHSENCISIRNSIKPFIIRNCTLLRPGPDAYNSGIYLRTVQNGIIYNNTLNYCDEGVYVDWYSRNITIRENIFISDNHTIPWSIGIYVAYLSHNVTIYDNYFFDYTECIIVGSSDSCIIERNFLNNTYMNYGGMAIVYSDYAKVLNNTFAGTLALYLYDEFVVDQIGCIGTIVENNTILIVPPQESGLQGSDSPQISGGGFTTLVNLESSDYARVIDNLLILEGIADMAAPTISGAPSDFTVYSNYTGVSISWTATEPNPDTYTIELQGSGIVAGPNLWASDLAVTYNVPDGLPIGDHIYTINFTDDYDYFITNTITMTVQEVPTNGDGDGNGNGTIHGYDIAILIGVIGVSVLLLKRTRKKK